MTALFSAVARGTQLRVLPSAPPCLVAGEVLIVRDRGDGLGPCVWCEAGSHYLCADKDGVLRDFEHA